MRIVNEVLLNNGDASGNLTSGQGLLSNMLGYSIQAKFSGSPSGTLTLQGSTDPVPSANFNAVSFPVTNWNTITGSSATISGADTITYNVTNTFYNWVRAIYTASSGSGTLTVEFNAKGA